MAFQLLQWWNLIFVVPFCIGVLLVLMSLSGAGRHGRGGHRVSHHGSHHGGHHGGAHHSHARMHARHQAPRARHKTTHAKGKASKSQGEEQAIEQAPSQGLMHMLHLDNIPSQMLLQNFLLFWGVVGWTCNRIASKSATSPEKFVVTSLMAALIGGLLCTLLISATLARFTPGDDSFAITKADLEGRIGEAVSAITERSGSVYARDENGTLHNLAARVRPDGESIARGEQVVVVSYFADGDYFQVKKWSA